MKYLDPDGRRDIKFDYKGNQPYVSHGGQYEVYFIYTYKKNTSKDQEMKAAERESINEEVQYLMDKGFSVKVIEAGTFGDIKRAFEDKDVRLIIFSGHGDKYGSIETTGGGYFSPNDLSKLKVSNSLETVIFENCYQGGSNWFTDDNKRKWENTLGKNVTVVGWRSTTSVPESKRFNDSGMFDRQKYNLMHYCQEIAGEN